MDEILAALDEIIQWHSQREGGMDFEGALMLQTIRDAYTGYGLEAAVKVARYGVGSLANASMRAVAIRALPMLEAAFAARKEA